jgi:ArsR family metal-binding transcriptional regulator
MRHYHCKIRKDHYWGVGQTAKPDLESVVRAGFSRRSAAQRLRRYHNAVLLLAGAGWEQVQITLTAEEAREIAEELRGIADEVTARDAQSGPQPRHRTKHGTCAGLSAK